MYRPGRIPRTVTQPPILPWHWPWPKTETRLRFCSGARVLGDGGICALIAQIQAATTWSQLQATNCELRATSRVCLEPANNNNKFRLKWALGQAMAGTFLCGSNDFGMVQLIDCLIECIELRRSKARGPWPKGQLVCHGHSLGCVTTFPCFLPAAHV